MQRIQEMEMSTVEELVMGDEGRNNFKGCETITITASGAAIGTNTGLCNAYPTYAVTENIPQNPGEKFFSPLISQGASEMSIDVEYAMETELLAAFQLVPPIPLAE